MRFPLPVASGLRLILQVGVVAALVLSHGLLGAHSPGGRLPPAPAAGPGQKPVAAQPDLALLCLSET